MSLEDGIPDDEVEEYANLTGWELSANDYSGRVVQLLADEVRFWRKKASEYA
jgi:hypothetical protein